MKKNIYLYPGMRTPFGDFGKSLRDVPLSKLATAAASACIRQVGVDPKEIDHVVWGNVLPVDHDGYFGARVIGLNAGLREASAALNVSRACGSGAQAVITAAEQIIGGHSDLALAGGGENFSRAPYVSTQSRWGARRGPQQLVDTLDWAYRDPFSTSLMGETAEILGQRFGIERAEMDEWALMSQQRAGAAIGSGFLSRQIEPIEVSDGRNTRIMSVDEFPRPDVTLQKLSQMRAAFRPDGAVTAGNSSGVTDGAAFLLVAGDIGAARIGSKPAARVIDWHIVGVSPEIMGIGPVPAINELLRKTNLQVSDIDYWEINEAFAVVNLVAEKQLGVSRNVTNLYGGGISLGHPPGATGARMLVVAVQHLIETEQRRAVVSMCMGAGQGLAILIERVS